MRSYYAKFEEKCILMNAVGPKAYINAVSYTHLDVYKRQALEGLLFLMNQKQ